MRGAFGAWPLAARQKKTADEMRQLKAELYKLLLPVVQGKMMVEVADRLIKLSTR